MTELFISGQRVILPADLSLKYTEENPFFTKRGEYTLDLTLSLLHPVNAKLYCHIDRLNVNKVELSKRKAILVIDNRVVLNGTEIIVSSTDTSVSIQLVSGNSELNYVSGSDLKLRDLDLGAELIYGAIVDDSSTWITSDLANTYPDRKHLVLPFVDSEGKLFGNKFHIFGVPGIKLRYSYDGHCSIKNTDGSVFTYANARPQPFLCFILEQIITLLGYSVGTNQIATHPVYKNLYIVHGFDTIEWAKMLPDWTVLELFNQVEKLFDCTFVVDNNRKSVSILFNHFKSTIKTVTLLVTDDFSDERDDSATPLQKNQNIGYSLDSDEYYKYASVDDLVYSKGIYEDWTEESNYNLIIESLIDAAEDTAEANRFKKVFHTRFGDFIICQRDGKFQPVEINTLKPIKNNNQNDGLDVELKIVPAPMKTFLMTVMGKEDNTVETTIKYHVQLPVAEQVDPIQFNNASDAGSYVMKEIISGEKSIAKTTIPDKIRLALYSGLKETVAFSDSTHYISKSIMAKYPTAFVQSRSEYFINQNTHQEFADPGGKPLSPTSLYNEIYSKTPNIDTSVTRKMTVSTDDKIDVQSRFIIRNKAYMCLKIEWAIDINGFKSLPTGYFHPIN